MINHDYTETAVYEGEPPSDVKVDGVHPALVRGYASMTERRGKFCQGQFLFVSAITYGWEQYFPHTNISNSIYKKEYFFQDMENKEPSYEDIPEECIATD